MFRWLAKLFRRPPVQMPEPLLPAQPKRLTTWWANPAPDDPPLAQGDYLPGCLVPVLSPDFAGLDGQTVPVKRVDLIVITQSCDLANNKAVFAALCPIFRLDRFEEVNPQFRKKGQWEEVRKGRMEGLHLLASPTEATNNREALVVDFRQIFSLPVPYLTKHAQSLSARWRLEPPFLEHFSQAFARFFMRVGLPSPTIPPFK